MLFAFAVFAFGVFGSFGLHTLSTSANQSQYSFRAYGDSISAGFGLKDYDNYVNQGGITTGSYPQVFANKYIEENGGQIQGYGASGDTSQDLASDLLKYLDKTAIDYQDFYNTNYFTLCIGANNILGPAMNNIGGSADEEFEKILQDGVNQFEIDYKNTILLCLTQNKNSKVFVMTIYNPYKHASAESIKVNTGSTFSDAIIKSVISSIDDILDISIEYLEKINKIIRESANDQVVVVDIYKKFETFSKKQYLEYINADLSKIEITSTSDLDNAQQLFADYVDPHPTAAGHNVIANEHIAKMPKTETQTQPNLDKNKKLTESEITIILVSVACTIFAVAMVVGLIKM